MGRKSILLLLLILVVIVVIYLVHEDKNKNRVINQKDISDLTNLWIHRVTVEHNPPAIAAMFCPGGSLVGTVSQIKRTGVDIERYFDYFAKLPGIRVISHNYNINQVAPNVFINTAFVTWYWDGLDQPVVARMSFVYNGKCISQLHSSVLPERNEALVRDSGRA